MRTKDEETLHTAFVRRLQACSWRKNHRPHRSHRPPLDPPDPTHESSTWETSGELAIFQLGGFYAQLLESALAYQPLASSK